MASNMIGASPPFTFTSKPVENYQEVVEQDNQPERSMALYQAIHKQVQCHRNRRDLLRCILKMENDVSSRSSPDDVNDA